LRDIIREKLLLPEAGGYEITSKTSALDLLQKLLGCETWRLNLRHKWLCEKGHVVDPELKGIDSYWRWGPESRNVGTQEMMSRMVCHTSSRFSPIDRRQVRRFTCHVQEIMS
jgi:hypothetical protein